MSVEKGGGGVIPEVRYECGEGGGGGGSYQR